MFRPPKIVRGQLRYKDLALLRRQGNHARIDQHLAGMLKIHGDAVTDHGLNLPDPPIRLTRMAHTHAGLQSRVETAFAHLLFAPREM